MFLNDEPSAEFSYTKCILNSMMYMQASIFAGNCCSQKYSHRVDTKLTWLTNGYWQILIDINWQIILIDINLSTIDIFISPNQSMILVIIIIIPQALVLYSWLFYNSITRYVLYIVNKQTVSWSASENVTSLHIFKNSPYLSKCNNKHKNCPKYLENPIKTLHFKNFFLTASATDSVYCLYISYTEPDNAAASSSSISLIHM